MQLHSPLVAETLAVPAHVWHQAFEGFLATPAFTPALSAFRAPALVAWGDRDAYAGRDSQDRLLAALPHARLRVYEGGGHAFHWEEPSAFVADLVPFLDDVRSGTDAGAPARDRTIRVG